jgi:hypothetical protein
MTHGKLLVMAKERRANTFALSAKATEPLGTKKNKFLLKMKIAQPVMEKVSATVVASQTNQITVGNPRITNGNILDNIPNSYCYSISYICYWG